MDCHLIFSVQLLQTLFLFEVKTDEVSDFLKDFGVDDGSEIINVIYGDIKVNPGDHISLLSTVLPPSVSWDTNSSSINFTLFLLDPDAVTTDVPGLSNSQFVHWCVTNIAGDDVTSGTVLAEYVPPSPPPGTKLHKYTFLLYINEHENDCGPFDRINFNIEKYALKCHLGKPVGYDYFKAGLRIQNIVSDVLSLR